MMERDDFCFEGVRGIVLDALVVLRAMHKRLGVFDDVVLPFCCSEQELQVLHDDLVRARDFARRIEQGLCLNADRMEDVLQDVLVVREMMGREDGGL